MEAKQTDLARLLMGTKAFVIPQFQRHYKWKRTQWAALFEDVLDQYNDPDVQSGHLRNNEGHFLGSVVLHPTPGPASTVSEYWVIDGQQRLITLLTLIAALRDFRTEVAPEWSQEEYDDQYLRNRYSKDRPYRLSPGENDRQDFISTVYEHKPSGLVGDAYNYFLQQLQTLQLENLIDFDVMERALFLRLQIVEINTSAEDNINQIFHTINHAGMKLSAIDLIRNHAFMQLASADAEEAYQALWKPLEDSFDSESHLVRYIWAQLVRKTPKATQKDLYQPFADWVARLARSDFDRSTSDAAKHALMVLRDEAKLFQSIENPFQHPSGKWSGELRDVVRDLATWNSVPTRPVMLEILGRHEDGRITDSDAADALRSLLSLLVRRALCGVPTNNLNRQLSPIPSQLEESPVAPQMDTLLSQESKYWPSDSDVRQKVKNTAIYVTADPRQVKYILSTLNRAANPSEAVGSSDLTVEHILPQTMTKSWEEYLHNNDVSVEEARARLHTLGNLTLTGYNSTLAQHQFDRKAVTFSESNLPLNRSLADKSSWLPADIDDRSSQLAEAAIALWLRGNTASSNVGTRSTFPVKEDVFTVEIAMSSIDAEEWTTVDALEQLCQAGEAEILEELGRLNYPVFIFEGRSVVSGDKEATKLPHDPVFLDAHDVSAAIQSVGTDPA